MPTFRTGLAQVVDPSEEETDQERLARLVEGLPPPTSYPGFETRTTPEGEKYYVPTGLSKPGEEVPIPEVSLPDVPKEPVQPPTALQPDEIPIPRSRPADAPKVEPPTSYDVTTPEAVPQTPNEQLKELEKDLPEPPPEPPRNPVEFATDPSRRFAAHAIGETLASPWTLASLAATGQQKASGLIKEGIIGLGNLTPFGDKVSEIMNPPMEDKAFKPIREAESSWDKFGRSLVESQKNIWGVTEPPKTGTEKLGQFVGESFVPMRQFTLPVTGLITSIRAMLDEKQGLGGTAQAGEAEDRSAALERLKRGEGARPTVPGTTPTLSGAPGAIPKAGVTHTPGMPKPGSSTYGLKPHKGDERKGTLPETPEEFARRVDQKRIEVEKKKAEDAKKFTPTATDFFSDFPTRAQTMPPSYGILGGLAVGSVVAATLPWTWRAIRNMRLNQIPTPRPVMNAAPGTMTIADPKLYTRYFDDSTTAALNWLRKAGIEPSAIDRLEVVARLNTRAGMRSMIDEAIKRGEFNGVNFNFKAPKPLAQIAAESTPESEQYLKILAAREDLITEAARRKFQPSTANPTPGPPTSGGMTEVQLRATQRALETSNPEVKQVAADFAAWKRARRKFEADGQYSTLPMNNPNWANPAKVDHSFQWLNRQAKYSEGKKPDATPFDQRLSPIEAEERRSRRAFANRMENDFVGLFIKESEDTKLGKSGVPLFKEVTRDELMQNPNWKPNAIQVRERGQSKWYTTDPTLRDQLLFDPVSITDPMAQAVYGAKRFVEMTNTGLPAYWFAPVNAARLWLQAKFTAPPGRWHPSLMHMGLSIPGQIVPQAAKAFATWLEHGSGGTMQKFLGGKQQVDQLAKSLVDFYDWTYYGQITKMGSARGTIVSQEQLSKTLAQATKTAQEYGGPIKDVWNAYAALISAIHESPGFAYTVQNWKKASPHEIISEARRLGGDSRIQGELKVVPKDPITGMRGTSRMPRFESPELGERLDAGWGKAWGIGSEIGRTAIPWFNPTEQAIKSMGKAYMDNPVRFVRDTWLYVGLPYAANYYWNYSLGNDPDGRSYVDHLTEGRGPYPSQMRMYWGWPGKRVGEGVEHDLIPQELSFLARMYTLGLHHALGKSKVFTELDDFKRAASGLLDVAIDPASPSIMSAWEASRGLVPGRGLFGGEVYKNKNQDPMGGDSMLPHGLEGFARSLFGGVAQIAGAAGAAFGHTNDGIIAATTNAAKAAIRTANEKTMFVRDLTGDKLPLSQSTDISKAMFERQRLIDELAHFYNNPAMAGGLNVMGGTTPGGRFAAQSPQHYDLGPPQAPEIPGLAPKPPTNPLYNMYMQEMYNYFKHEAPNPVKKEDAGGIGYKTIWARHGDASAALKSLRNIDEGNFGKWQLQLAERPLALEELKRSNIDTTNLRQVKNYYIGKMQDVDRVIFQAQLHVEKKLSQQAGRPITLWDIRPYGSGVEGEQGSFIFPDLLGMNWGTDPGATGPVAMP